MTVTPSGVDYTLPTNLDTITPMVDPSHSELHNDVNRVALDLSNRLSQVEMVMAGLTAPNGSIQQARLVAHQWVVAGELQPEHTNMILLPLIWNLTGRTVAFQAAKATVLTPADADILLDMVIGTTLNGAEQDQSGATQTSILKNGPVVIPAGEFYSATLDASAFRGDQPINSYIAAFIEQIGSPAAPGADLNLQLNRNL